jgi:hypothetical protein
LGVEKTVGREDILEYLAFSAYLAISGEFSYFLAF